MKAIFIILGSIIGAGFISGRELVRFFGDAYPPFLLFAACFFAFGIFIFLRAGNRYGGFVGFCKKAFGRRAPLVRGVFYLSSFVVVTAMLAGVNALEEKYAPFIAVLSAGICLLIVRRGMGGLGAFNLFLVPSILVYVFVCLGKAGRFALVKSVKDPGMGILFCILYVCMNLFLSASVLLDCGARLKKEWILPTACVSAGILGGCIALILAAVSACPGAKEHTMPLMSVIRRQGIYPLISYFGILTTLISAYYPLHAAAGKFRNKNAVRAVLLGAASLFSLFGLKDIVEFVYPLLGVFGFLLLAVCAFYDELFQKFYGKVHQSRQKAKHQRGRHDEV